ncbi:hypothetical protein P3S68_001405 [Capsicum galapagoense]
MMENDFPDELREVIFLKILRRHLCLSLFFPTPTTLKSHYQKHISLHFSPILSFLLPILPTAIFARISKLLSLFNYPWAEFAIIAGEAIASSESLKKLNLSFLVNVSDATIVAIAESCKNLDALNLTSCEFVTGEGVRTLKKHRSLKELILTSCEKFSGYDLEELVLGCQMLEYIIVDKRLRMWVPMEVQDIIMREHCWID